MTKYEGDSLGTRMKSYESTFQSNVMRRSPVIIRIDGRAFHTYTKRLAKLDPSLKDTPFSKIMHEVMMDTTRTLVDQVQNCVFGYTQSDEISLLLRDWDFHETEQWFNGNAQKIVSISASIATAAFNYYFRDFQDPERFSDMAQFDSRVYNIPKEEVTNYFIWRQQDASRNSVQMLGRFYFSQKQMHGKRNSEVQDLLMLQEGVNWNDIPTWMKRGSCVTKRLGIIEDNDIPVFTQDREYVEKHLTAPPLQVNLMSMHDSGPADLVNAVTTSSSSCATFQYVPQKAE